jgi:hypothetical protein
MAITAYTTKYYDDVNTPDTSGLTPLDKNYLRVLFQPGRTVQARELNQAQSLLQAQLDRLGQSLFKPNSAIVGGECNVDNTLSFIDAEFVSESAGTDFLNKFNDGEKFGLKDISVTTSATLVHAELVSGATYRLFIQYINSDSQNESAEFTSGSAIIEGINSYSETIAVPNTGKALSATLSNGVFFVKGCLASSTEQLVVRALGTDELFDGYVVLKIEENQVPAESDQTLFDNANGTANFSAPGADRYQIGLTLEIVEDFNEDNDHVVLLQIKDNEVIIVQNPIDNSNATLEKVLAQRTFEESGSYTVNDFNVEIQEVLSSESFTGRYKNSTAANDLSQSEADGKFAATLSPSVAYIRGKRIELSGPLTLLGDKARVSSADLRDGVLENGSVVASMGNYVEGNFRNLISPHTGGGIPFLDNYSREYNLFDSSVDSPRVPIGTCKILSVEFVSGTKYRVFLHAISLNAGKIFDDVETIEGAAVDDYGTVDFEVQTRNGIKLHDTNINSALFQLPYTTVKKFNSIQVSEKVNFSSTVGADSRVTFDVTGATFDKSASSILVYNENQTEVLEPTDFTVVSDSDVDSITLEITSADEGDTIGIIGTVVKDLVDLGIKTKTTETITLDISPAPAVDDIVELPGVYHLISVEDDNFELVTDGQTSTQYTSAKVRCLKAGETTVDVVHWKFSGGNYYTVNSYRNAGGGQASLDDIPLYNGNRLGDFFDVRPYPDTTDILALDPYSAITGKIDYYLPRIDSITILDNGDFSIEKGTPSLTPVPPVTSSNGLILFNLNVPPYTFEATNILIQSFNHQRYTMRDIGRIDKRVSTLEYYTTLSLLEKSANDKSIFDADGTSRFKNGIVTDGFRNFTIGDEANIDFRCHYETDRGHLYPEFDSYSIPLELTSSSGVDVDSASEFTKSGAHNEVLTLPFNEVEYINQPYATQFISVQPYDSVALRGSLNLVPEVDTWKDTITEPPRNIDLSRLIPGAGQSGLRQAQAEARRQRRRAGQRIGGRRGRGGRRNRRRPRTNGWRRTSIRRAPGLPNRWWEVTEQREIVDVQVVQTQITENLGEFLTDVEIKPYARSKAVYFRAQSLKPNTKFYLFVDDIDVTNYAHLLTQDDIVNSHDHTDLGRNVSSIEEEIQNVKFLEDGIEIPTWFGTRWSALKASDRAFASSLTNRTAGAAKNFWSYVNTIITEVEAGSGTDAEKERQINDLLPGFDQSSLAQYDGADEATLLDTFVPSDIISDANGVAEGILVIPNNDNLKFSSGEKTVTITNSPRNLESESTSNANARYISNGLETNKQSISLSVTLPRVVNNSRTETRTRNIYDPIAQSFAVTEDTGIFTTSIDLFFAGKPAENVKVPIQSYIVTTVNGYPTDDIVPGSEAVVDWEDVRTSADGSIPTTFRYPYPVYLSPDTEYAMVCFSTSFEYTAYIAELGGDKTDLITGHIISSQPVLGTFFASSNKTTWTAMQNRDLKFILRRGSFATNQTAQLVSNPQMGTHLEEIEVENMSNNSGWDALTTTVTIEAPFTTVVDNEGVVTKAEFEGGITATAIPIFDPADDSIASIDITKKGFGYLEAPTVTITDGTKTETLLATMPQYNVGAFALNQKAINLGGKTSIRNEVYLEDTKYDVEVGTPVEYITNQNHNIQGSNIDKTRLQTFFSSTDERVTPVINRDFSLETRDYFINETGDTSQYLSKEFPLDNLSDQIDMYLDINRPSSTSNIEVYAQLKDANGSIIESTETDTDWHSLSAISPTSIPINTNRDEFSEVRFNLNSGTTEFSSFIIKIVMRGEYYGDAPFAKDLRIIATV